MKKRMQKRGMAGILTAGLLLSVLTGCGAADTSARNAADLAYETVAEIDSAESYSSMWDSGSYEETDLAAGTLSEAAQTEENVQTQTDRKLIRNVGMDVETKEYDQFMVSLEDRVGALGGYIEDMESYNGSRYSDYRSSRYANITIRMPQEKLDSFLESLEGFCNVVRRTESVDDVTLTYVDMESHRDMLKTEQKRLLELLDQAESLEDILTIESRLTEVRYQLESMEAQLRTMDNKVQYSTVSVYVSEVRELTNVVTHEQTAWERITEGFMDSLRSVGSGFAEFGIWFLIHIPQLVLWALVITAAVLIIRRRRKKKAAKKQQTAENRQRTADENRQETKKEM